MLKVIRESAIERPWFYRTLMFLIAAIFVVTMGRWGFEENKEDIIVRVGDDKVSRTEYLQAYQRLFIDNHGPRGTGSSIDIDHLGSRFGVGPMNG